MSDDRTGAVISDCQRYRYRLWRRWSYEQPRMVFIMLNPSTADASKDDATIRRCIGFAKASHAGSIEVVNLFAYRATNPAELWKVADPVGSENDGHILAAARSAFDEGGYIVLAWGSNAKDHPREQAVRDLLFFNVYCTLHVLRVNGDGTPAHPLRLPKELKPVEYEL